MSDKKPDSKHPAGDVAHAPNVNDTTSRAQRHIESGAEATRGAPPAKHDDEHQSEYGGGGTNGGVK